MLIIFVFLFYYSFIYLLCLCQYTFYLFINKYALNILSNFVYNVVVFHWSCSYFIWFFVHLHIIHNEKGMHLIYLIILLVNTPNPHLWISLLYTQIRLSHHLFTLFFWLCYYVFGSFIFSRLS